MLGKGESWSCVHLGRVGGCGEVGFGQCWGLWVRECEVWGWGISGRGAWLWSSAQDWEEGERSHRQQHWGKGVLVPAGNVGWWIWVW